MKNENGYFVVSDTDIAKLSAQVAEHLKNGSKIIGPITTYHQPDTTTITHLQTMLGDLSTDKETTLEKFRNVVELNNKKDDLERQFHLANKKWTDLSSDRRSNRIAFDSFKDLVEAENEKNRLEKEFNEVTEQYAKYSKAASEYMNKIKLETIHDFDDKHTITLHNGELWVQGSR